MTEIEDKQEDISDIDTDTNVEAGTEDKPEEITVKQEKKGFVGKLFIKRIRVKRSRFPNLKKRKKASSMS